MFRPVVFLFCLFIFGLTPYLSLAMTPEQKAKIHEEFQKLGMECIKEHAISEDDIKELRAHKLPTGENVPCFIACMMKKAGIMNDNGLLQNEKVLEEAKKIFEDDEELKNIESYLHSCSHINSESVSDGEKGCERAVLAYKCMTENASQIYQKTIRWECLKKTEVIAGTINPHVELQNNGGDQAPILLAPLILKLNSDSKCKHHPWTDN